MRTDLVAGELTLLQSGEYDEHWRLKIANGDGTLIDISTRLKDGSVRLPDPDSPIGTAEVTLWREINDEANDSLSPLVASSFNVLDDDTTPSPLIRVGRAATLEIAVTARGGARPASGSASWHELIGGFVKQPYWPKRYGDIRIELHDRAYKLKRTHIESPNTYVIGTTIEAAIQAVLDDVMGSGVYTLAVDGLGSPSTATGSALSVNYTPDIVPVWDAIQGLAKTIGWVLWYRYDGSGVAQLTLTEPRRAKVTADYTFTTAQVADIEELTIIEEDIRNVVVVAYLDTAEADQSVTAEDATSIATYGGIRRFMKIAEGVESPIRTQASAEMLRDAALADTKDPDADQAIKTIGAWWPGEPSVDLMAFDGNEFVYDSAQTLAPYAISLQFAQGTLSSATVRARGKPSAGSGTWRDRARKPPDDVAVSRRLGLQNFREISRSATVIKYGWTLGANLEMSFIHDYQEAQPYTVDKWPVSTRVPDSVDRTRDVEYEVSIPEAGRIGYFQVEGRQADGSFGDMERVLIFPANVDADFVAFLEATVNQADGSVFIEGWTTDRALSVAYAYTTGTDPTSPTIAMAEAQGAGATGGGLVTGFSSDFSISLGAGTLAYGEKIKVLVVAYLNANGTGPDGTATDHGLPLGAQAERFKITVSDQITDGVVIANKLRESSRSFITDVAFSATDWDTVAWTSGTLTLSDGTAYSIASGNTGNLATNAIRYIYFDSAISTTVLQVATATADAIGEDAVLLCVAKRATAGASSGQGAFFVPAVGVLGINSDAISPKAILEANLDDLAVTAAKVAVGAIETDKLAALAVTTAKIAAGAVTEDEIDALAVTAAKVAAGAIETDKLAALAVATGKLALSAVDTAQLNALAVTGAKIAAHTITAAKITALTITAVEIAASTITGGKIAALTITAANIVAGTITTTEIAAGTITAGNILAGTITGTEIAAGTIAAGNIISGTITTTQIAALTIVAGNIVAGTITTTEIAAGTILAANISAGTITGTEIAAVTIAAGNIVAGTITTTEIAANTIVAGNIAALTITAAEIAATTITGAKIAAGTITATNIFAGTITATEIAAATITGAEIAAGTIAAINIVANTITAAEINVATLSAISADIGTVTAGTIEANVIVASESFTATLASFNGVLVQDALEVQGLIQFTTSGAIQIEDGRILDFSDAAVDAGFADMRYTNLAGGETGLLIRGGIMFGAGGKMGFFGTTPAAQPTSVVVSAAGIHAALVTLGLIT